MSASPSRRGGQPGLRRLSVGPLRTLLICLSAVPLATAQETPPVFSSDVELVRLHLTVLDDAGEPVVDLRPEDIRIQDGEREYPAAILLSPTDTPLDVALVLDLSNSMRWQEGRERAERLIDTLGADDCVFLLGFSSRVGGSLWAGPDDPGLAEALLNAEAFGGTALYDAMLVALTELSRSASGTTLRGSTTAPLNPELGGTVVRRVGDGSCPVALGAGDVARRRAIVLVSDGMDSTSRARLGDLRITAALGEVPIFPVQLPVDERGFGGRRALREVDGPAVLAEIAEVTGGRVVDSDREGYRRLVSLLRGSWVVGYYADSSRGSVSRLTRERRPVRVRVDRPGVTVLHRPARLRMLADPAAARQYVAEAAEFLDQGLPDAADAALARALAADPEYAPAFHLRALAGARSGALAEALDDALRATDLGPGAVDRHQLAMRLALMLERPEVAWEQAILATQAGLELGDVREELEAIAPPPEDFAARLQAPRVAVARPYVESTNPLLDGGTEIVARAMRRAIAASAELALIADPTLADFVVSVRARTVSLEPPHALSGTVRVASRGGDVRYAGTLNVRDVELAAEVEREMESHVRGMRSRLRRER